MPGTTSTTNNAQVGAWVIDLTDFGFKSPLNGKTVGEVCVDNHVQQIRERSIGEQRGAGLSWPENDPEYARQKEEEYGTSLINVRSGQMLSEESVHGQVTVSDKQVLHLYGTGRPGDPEEGRMPPKPRKGKPRVRKTRPEPTDVAKAAWAAEQGRGFFELDEQIKARNEQIVAEGLAEHLRSR